MEERVNSIVSEIEKMENVKITTPFSLRNEFVYGAVALTVSEVTLDFKVVIAPQYPFQLHEQETIQFINIDLLEYNHVNVDGSICVHTVNCPDLARKLWIDLEGLKHWISKYFIGRSEDEHYEHLIGTNSLIGEEELIFLFTNLDHDFSMNEHGRFKYTFLSKGKNRTSDVNTCLIQEIISDKVVAECKWSNNYKQGNIENGVFVFIENPPTLNGRFLIKNWKELEVFVSQSFLSFLYKLDTTMYRNKNEKKYLPLLIGYRIPEEEIHWQCAMIETDNFPNYGVKITGTGNYEGRFRDEGIKWVSTKNCSYKYFFGRGVLHSKITDSKVLLLGLGAVGSMVATTLTRGGCKSLTLVDYDIKEPENVCRSEYFFASGINLKTKDLGLQLSMISPFVEIFSSEFSSDFMKIFLNKDDKEGLLKEHLSQYDIIIDCTADNDVLFMLDKAEPNTQVISLSITNNANQLICAVGSSINNWTNEISSKFETGNEELYNPTGCWNPTFKASYNDIAMLVQLAINHINKKFESGNSVRNFVITADEDSTNLIIKQY